MRAAWLLAATMQAASGAVAVQYTAIAASSATCYEALIACNTVAACTEVHAAIVGSYISYILDASIKDVVDAGMHAYTDVHVTGR